MTPPAGHMNPRQVTLDVSSACNLRCIYCAVAGSCHEDGPALDVPAALARLRAEGYGLVVLSGGEPTLHRELPAWIALARALGFEQRTIVTNGTRLGDRELVRELTAAGLTHVNVSFHTCRPELFDQLAGVAGAFARARAGLETLLAVNDELGHPLYLHTNLLLMRQTAGHVGETVGWLGALGVRHVTIELVRSRGAVVGHETAFRCSVAELARALAEARAAAARFDVVLNTVDLPPCLLGEPGELDLASYVVRREKEIHWVVSGRSEGLLNRDTHWKAPSCARCAFDRWCTGIERTLLDGEPGREGEAAGRRAFPAPIPPARLLAALGRGLAPQTRQRALDACSLTTPLDAPSITAWLELYHAYAVTLLPLSADDSPEAAEALGLFVPAGRRLRAERAAALAQSIERRERVLEERLGALAAALRRRPASPPECCARAAGAGVSRDGAGADVGTAAVPLAWLQSLVRESRSSWLCSALLPELLPYVWCSADCAQSLELARRRIAELSAPDQRAATQLLSAPVLALGPWARVVLSGATRGARGVGYDPRSLVVLTDRSLDASERAALRRAAARFVMPQLLAGDELTIERDAIVVRERGREVAELPRRLRWAAILCAHGAVGGLSLTERAAG